MKKLFTFVLLFATACVTTSASNAENYIQLNPKRLVKLEGFVKDQMPGLANKVLKLAKPKAEKKPAIDIFINSPGGSLYHGDMLVQAIKSAQLRGYTIRCTVGSQAASMAFVIFIHCDERFAMPTSNILWHPARIRTNEAISEQRMKQMSKHIEDRVKMYNDLAIRELGVTSEYYYKHYHAETLHIGHQLAKDTQGFMKLVQDIRGITDLYK